MDVLHEALIASIGGLRSVGARRRVPAFRRPHGVYACPGGSQGTYGSRQNLH
jgi:hypothetical protein